MWCVSIVFCAGCSRLNPQADTEAKFAGDITGWLKRYESEVSRSPVTNLSELFPLAKHGYPYFHHRQLSEHGKYSGFTNSLVEKYSFFWPRFTNRFVQGEVICMNAQPFPGYGDGLYRIYIAQSDGAYIHRAIPEMMAQRIFAEMKSAVVPLPNVGLPPPPPKEVQESWNLTLAERYDRFVWRLSYALGLDSSTPVRIGLLFGAVLLVAVLAWSIVFCWRK